MRDTLRLTILAALFSTVGCSTYDRELLGDPEPAPVAQAASAEEPTYAQPPLTDDSLGVGMFDELGYYGQWYTVDPYGWVWRPTVVSEWQPFASGHWIWSQYGWMWVDYDPWGWATSHYGYWAVDYAMGWIWIPDYTWSPVQCEWLIYDDYICWAPVPPPGTRYKEPWEEEKAWVTVPTRKFKEPAVANYRETPKFKSTTDHQIRHGAPDVRDVEKYGPRFSRVDVQLERRVVGEREFAKVKYPPDQEQIVQGQRTRVKTNSTTARFTPTATPATSNGGNSNDNGSTVGPPQPQPSKTKSKEPASKGDSGKKETKIKSKKSDDKKGEEKSKDKEKEKG